MNTSRLLLRKNSFLLKFGTIIFGHHWNIGKILVYQEIIIGLSLARSSSPVFAYAILRYDDGHESILLCDTSRNKCGYYLGIIEC